MNLRFLNQSKPRENVLSGLHVPPGLLLGFGVLGVSERDVCDACDLISRYVCYAH